MKVLLTLSCTPWLGAKSDWMDVDQRENLELEACISSAAKAFLLAGLFVMVSGELQGRMGPQRDLFDDLRDFLMQ